MGEFPNKPTQFKPGESGNPDGLPKGTRHLSTWIQELMHDEEFEANILDSTKGLVQYKGAPVKAMIMVALQKALNDQKNGQKWADWLAKYGWGTKVDITSGGEKIRGGIIGFADNPETEDSDTELS